MTRRVAPCHRCGAVQRRRLTVEYATLISDQIILLGRDRTASGEVASGAKVQRVIDLKERQIAWRPHRRELPAFRETVKEILDLFPKL